PVEAKELESIGAPPAELVVAMFPPAPPLPMVAGPGPWEDELSPLPTVLEAEPPSGTSYAVHSCAHEPMQSAPSASVGMASLARRRGVRKTAIFEHRAAILGARPSGRADHIAANRTCRRAKRRTRGGASPRGRPGSAPCPCLLRRAPRGPRASRGL